MSEDKLQDAIVKGSRASSLLASETFRTAIDDVKSMLIAGWQKSQSAEERERYWISVHLVDHIKRAIVVAADNGKISQAQLNRLVNK